jgi:hypothetical protein
MTKRLLIITCFVLAVFVITPNFSDVHAQEGQDQEQKAREGAASKGKDPNIREDEKANDKNDKTQPPAKKGGTSKGAPCEVQLDNWTPWNIKIYIDGEYLGTMIPYGESYAHAVPGRVTVYARADFGDGSYLYWGPRDYSCGPNQYIYFKMTE